MRVSTRLQTSVDVCDSHLHPLPVSDSLCCTVASSLPLWCVTVVPKSLSWYLYTSFYPSSTSIQVSDAHLQPLPVSDSFFWSLTVSAAPSHLLCDRGRVTVVNNSLSWSLEEPIRVFTLPRTSVEVCDTHLQPLPVCDSFFWSLTVSAATSHLLYKRGCMHV